MNNIYQIRPALILSGLLALSLLGCKEKPKATPPSPTKITLEAKTSATINRDSNGDPLSVVVRAYHLKDKAEFSKLSFDLLAAGRTDQELLGAECLGRSEFVMVPGSTLSEGMELPPGTEYVAVVGLFRKPDPNYWRFLVSLKQLEPDKKQRKALKLKKTDKLPISFEVQDCYLSLSSCKPETIPGQPENAKPECSAQAIAPPAPAPAPAPSKPTPSPRRSRLSKR